MIEKKNSINNFYISKEIKKDKMVYITYLIVSM